MENDIRTAIEAGEFELYYQPKFDLARNVIVGAEALIRWNHSGRGYVQPDDFIPLAEETGLIVPLGRWVIGEACKQLEKWHDSELQNMQIAINISSHQFTYDNLLEIMVTACKSAKIRPGNLELEITESALMGDHEEMVELLKSIKDLDVSISIDDFGTGYSSLAYLKRYPVDKLKIDRSFVQHIHTNSSDAAICAAIIAMSKELGMEVVAEGVENQQQQDFLSQHGCDQIQGYIISPAIPAGEFEKLALSSREMSNPGASKLPAETDKLEPQLS